MKRLSALMLCLLVSSLSLGAPAASKDRQMLLDVQPAAAPLPALRYQLLPEISEMNPGNAVQGYLKCFAEQTNFFFKKESSDEREKYLNCPLSDIKPGSLKGYGGSALKQADRAARMETCDWNLLLLMREQGYMLLLPELQQMRTLTSALAVRCRGEIADKDYDGAVHTLKTIFALARHLGEHPTVIAGLVGVAVANIGVNLVEELVQQPGAPNLYWAITNLPNPLVDLRKGFSSERMITEATFGNLLDGKDVWNADDQAKAGQKMKEFASFLELTPDERAATEAWRIERLKDEPWLTAARKSLVEVGEPTEAVAKYPPDQVFLLYLFRKARVEQDEALKWVGVPYWQAESSLQEMEKGPKDMEAKLTRQMVFSVPRIQGNHLRLEQRLALLRTVEALRLQAAKNGGKLPPNLGDVGVPMPIDPASGKAFEYKLDGMTAILAGRSVPSGTTFIKYSYEVRLRK
jgi:hypothetical protein